MWLRTPLKESDHVWPGPPPNVVYLYYFITVNVICFALHAHLYTVTFLHVQLICCALNLCPYNYCNLN